MVLTLAALAASGCGIFKKGAPKTPVLGERVAVLDGRAGCRRRSGYGRAARCPFPSRSRTPNGPRPAAMPSKSMRPSRARPVARAGLDGHRSARAARSSARLGAAAGRRRRPGLHHRHAIDGPGLRRSQTGAQRLGDAVRRRESGNQRLLVRRRRRVRQRPHLCDQRPWLCHRARCAQRRHHLAGPPDRPAARLSDRRRRHALRDQPGQPDLFAQDERRLDRTGRRRPRWKSPACSARLLRQSGRARSSPASRRASSTPIATRMGASSGRTSWRERASGPASPPFPTSMPTRSSTMAR